ncbi:hypothetical protein HN873_060936, partial [Arachis hypogaea]
KIVWEKTVYHTFTVNFDSLSQEVRCECNKFESTGILCCHTLVVWSYYRADRVSSCYVLPRWNKNVIRKHTYIKSSHDVARTDEGHNLFKRLCSEFYNVAQEFVNCDEEAVILRSALWDAKSKLTDYRASMRLTTIAATQNTMPTQSTGGVVVHDIQGLSRVKTKGRPKSKRLEQSWTSQLKNRCKKGRENRIRNTLFLAPGWNDIAAAEIGGAPINAPRSMSRTWERLDVLERSAEVNCCPHVVDGGMASDEGGGEVYPMILVLWCSRGWFLNSAVVKR